MSSAEDTTTLAQEESLTSVTSFFEQNQVEVEQIKIGKGVPIGITQVFHPQLGIGGAYGAWGESYDNSTLPDFLSSRLGETLAETERLDLAPLGFQHRHHIAELSDAEHCEVEIEVGARYLKAAAQACGWQPQEVEGLLIGNSSPVATDFTEQIAHRAGIPDDALKVSVHKACDSSMSALHLALNPELIENNKTNHNLAKELLGRKILVGGIEGLSRFTSHSRDTNALQLFGNGAGIIGIIPGKTMSFLVGKAREVFDEKGLLAVRMFYPFSRETEHQDSLVEVTQVNDHHLRVAGMMHEPEGDKPIEMAGLMGMVKLFVRSGVDVVRDVYVKYQQFLSDMGMMEKNIKVSIVHHANYKINKLKWSQLSKEGINLFMPWVLSEFGNVSAASNMIAFLRQLPNLNPGDHILFDGFGAGTYYDVFATALGQEA
jgi:3-oxoacyl-[acyl-carrier-protein] synthase III